MYYQVKDASYWYEVHGEGIPIVLLHGFTGSRASWNEITRLEQSAFQWITVDLPGHGKTKTAGIKSMADCCADLHGLFTSLNLERFFLLGYSLGGRTALTYARHYPEALQGLILESASPGLKTRAEQVARRTNDLKLINRIETDGLQAFIHFWENIPLFATQKALPIAKQRDIRDKRLQASPQGLVQSLAGMGTGAQPSNWNVLDKITLPVLLLAGTLDKKFVNINQQMLEKFPNAQLKLIEDAGHTIHVEKPATYGKMIRRFIEQQTEK